MRTLFPVDLLAYPWQSSHLHSEERCSQCLGVWLLRAAPCLQCLVMLPPSMQCEPLIGLSTLFKGSPGRS